MTIPSIGPGSNANFAGINLAKKAPLNSNLQNINPLTQGGVDAFTPSNALGVRAPAPSSPTTASSYQFQVPGTAQRTEEAMGPFNVLKALSDGGIGHF